MVVGLAEERRIARQCCASLVVHRLLLRLHPKLPAERAGDAGSSSGVGVSSFCVTNGKPLTPAAARMISILFVFENRIATLNALTWSSQPLTFVSTNSARTMWPDQVWPKHNTR